MTFAEIRQEVKSRLNGSRFLSTTRVNKFINDAQQELDRMYCWPYREKSVTGTAPLAVSDLDQVEAVLDTNQNIPLLPVDWRLLLDLYGDLSLSGKPTYYYIAWPAGVPDVATYPVSTSTTIGVQYWKITTDLSADSDTPASPAGFHGILTDMAVRRAYRAQGMYEQAIALSVDIDKQIQNMLVAIPPGIPDGPAAYQSASLQDF